MAKTNVDDQGKEIKKEWKLCWFCGKAESKGQKFSRCGKCVNLKLATPASYCSKACQEQDWERHKQYYKNIKNRPKSSLESVQLSPDECLIKQEYQDDEYIQLMIQSREAEVAGNQKLAHRLLEKAIKMTPENPCAHSNLAILYQKCNNSVGAINELLEVMRIAESGGPKLAVYENEQLNFWCHAVTEIFHICYQYEASCSLLTNTPEWMKDPKKQLEMSKSVCKEDPENPVCWLMCADACTKLGLLDEAIDKFLVAIEHADSQAMVERIRQEMEVVQLKREQQNSIKKEE